MSGMRESRLEPVQRRMARIPRVGPVLFALAAVAFALVSAYAVPHAVVALGGLNDPARIADHALDGRFDAGVAQREIEAALAAHDADLAQSFVDLAADRSVAIDPAQVQKVNAATAEAATTRHKAESFARGFITGEPDDMAALAGTTLGDLFVFGDIRDALREGKRLVTGEQADELVLGSRLRRHRDHGWHLRDVRCGRAGAHRIDARQGRAQDRKPDARNLPRASRLWCAARLTGGPCVRAQRTCRSPGQRWRNVRRAKPSRSSAPAACCNWQATLAASKEPPADAPRSMVSRSQKNRVTWRAWQSSPRKREAARVRFSRLRAAARLRLRHLPFDAAVWMLGAMFAVLGFVSALKNATERAALALFPPPPGTAQPHANCRQLPRLQRTARHHAWRSFANGEVEIAYLDEGDGDPIVLVHGFASTKEVNWLHPGWVATLTREGRRVIALDNRGHGASGKLYDPSAYHSATMADDVRALLDHLKIERADVMGYSMGARITAFLAVKHPGRVRSAILGGLGIRLVEGVGLPESIADALEAPSLDDVRDPTGRVFRIFADQTKSDLRALAACIRGSRQTLGRAEVAAIRAPVLVAVGTKDQVAGSAAGLGGAHSGCTRARYPGPRPHAGGRRQGL